MQQKNHSSINSVQNLFISCSLPLQKHVLCSCSSCSSILQLFSEIKWLLHRSAFKTFITWSAHCSFVLSREKYKRSNFSPKGRNFLLGTLFQSEGVTKGVKKTFLKEIFHAVQQNPIAFSNPGVGKGSEMATPVTKEETTSGVIFRMRCSPSKWHPSLLSLYLSLSAFYIKKYFVGEFEWKTWWRHGFWNTLGSVVPCLSLRIFFFGEFFCFQISKRLSIYLL